MFGKRSQTEPSHECSWACGVNKYGADEHAQTEPTAILFSARQGGKSQALIDSMLAQANERGIRVEVVYPQSEPTDAQVNAALLGYFPEVSGDPELQDWGKRTRERMRAALKAAFTAGQEEKS